MKDLITLLFSIIFTQIIFSQQKVDFLIHNVSIAPMNKNIVLERKDVVIDDGKIIAITDTESKEYSAEKTIDGTGKFMLPSFGDAHVHLPKEKGEIEKYLALNFINGVTKLRSMRGNWKHVELRGKLDSLVSPNPKIHLSPPPMHRSFDLTKEQLTKYVEGAKKGGFDFFKMLSIKDESLFKQLNQLCQENDLYIAGHFPKNLPDNLIFNSQINCFEHLGGLIGVEENLQKQRMDAIKENDIFISPTLSWYVIGYGQYSVDYMKNQRGMEYIAPETVGEWAAGTNKYRKELGKAAFEAEVEKYAAELKERYAVINQLNKMGVKLLISPDASSKWIVPGFGLLEEMKLYQKAGLSNYDILRAATVNYADYFNEMDYGTIEVGKNADFILLEENPLESLETLTDICGIFYGGSFVNERELEKMAASILPAKNSK